MTFYNLALKNVKNQYQYYFMYFISMTFAVMIYYSFVSLSYDATIMAKASQDLRIDLALRTGSFMIMLFVIVFMFSANTFFIKRRKREIGLYSLLGMRRRQIGLLFFSENMILGLGSLFIGILLGMAFSKMFAMLLLKIMTINLEKGFVFSGSAIISTLIVFILLILIISARTARVVYRSKLIDLFKSEQQSDGTHRVTPLTWILGVIGIGCLSLGYYLATHFLFFVAYLDEISSARGMGLLLGPTLIGLICVLGTYIFFGQFLTIVIWLVQKIKRYYYKDINMITTGNLSFHLKKNATLFATISVLAGAGLSAIGIAASVHAHSKQLVSHESPTSYAVTEKNYDRLTHVLETERVSIIDEYSLKFKLIGFQLGYSANGTYFEDETMYSIISQSNYEGAKKIVPNITPIHIEHEKDVVLLGGSSQFYLDSVIEFNDKGILGEVGEVTIKSVTDDYIGNMTDMRVSRKGLIVSDKLYQKLSDKGSFDYRLINVEGSDTNHDLSKTVLKEMEPCLESDYYFVANTTEEEGKMVDNVQQISLAKKEELLEKNTNHQFVSRQQGFSERYTYFNKLRMSSGLLVYISIFLGLVFMVATGSMIMLKQLSEAEDEKYHYGMLRKIGTPREMITKSVYKQNFIVFFVPLFVSVLHTIFALSVLFTFIEKPRMLITYLSIVLLVAIYGLFYIWTSASYNKIINMSN